jgi:hypothetical protein
VRRHEPGHAGPATPTGPGRGRAHLRGQHAGPGRLAFLAPESFAQFIDYPPDNRHLIHDAGAFQLGIGATVLLALWWSDALVVALTGFAVASALHTVSHWTDRNLGGHGSDVPSLGLLTLVALIAIYLRIQERKR